MLGEDFWCGSHRMFRPDGTELPLEQCPMAEAILQEHAVTREAIIERADAIIVALTGWGQAAAPIMRA